MNDSKPLTTVRFNEIDGTTSGGLKTNVSIPTFGNRSAYLSRNPNGYMPSYNPVHYPGSYNHLSYSPAPLYNHAAMDRYNNIAFSVPNNMAMNLPSSHHRNWNGFNLPSPLTTSSAKCKSTSKPHAKVSNTDGPEESKPSSSPNASHPISSNEYIDPKILEGAQNLNLPENGQKYSVAHWKAALGLCYRWKTTTNEDERQFYRTSTTTNSISSSTLKSIKFFCENILHRKTKRRQFAIHWKESGLKKIVDESSSSDNTLIEYNDPKLETLLDDYFSGRTRSTGYTQAKERLLEDRQKEIFFLWDKLMSGPVLSKASSHQKLYLIQLAIERPYRNKKIEIETMDKKIVHDVAIEGYGGKSYWEKTDPGDESHEKPDASGEPTLKPFEKALPTNEAMVKRFWKCADAYCSPERQGKKRRVDSKKTSHQLEQNIESQSNESLPTRESVLFEEDKENERVKIVAV